MAEFCFKSGSIELGAKTYIMGILNVTPDSFSDGGRYNEPSAAVAHALEMAGEGADIIDIGAQSTRPGHVPITAEQEWQRLRPVLESLRNYTELPLSIDTYHTEVAAMALETGASIINDVSGSMENGMPELAAKTGAGLIMMHSGGGSDDGGQGSDAIKTVDTYFERALKKAAEADLPIEQICLDPGIGFGKDRQGDLALIARLPELIKRLPKTAVLVGASRKRVISSCCENSPPASDRLPGTIAIHTIAVLNGAHILRVHDVAASVQAARVADEILKHIND